MQFLLFWKIFCDRKKHLFLEYSNIQVDFMIVNTYLQKKRVIFKG